MNIFFWLAGCLFFYFVTILGISVAEWTWRKRTGNIDALSNSEVYFPLNLSMIYYKWMQFSSPFAIPVLAIGLLFLAGFSQNDNSIFDALGDTLQTLWLGVLILTFVIVAVQHLFGRRVGQFLFLFVDFAITDSELLFRPYGKWQAVPWTSVTSIKQRKFPFGISYGNTLRIVYESSLPNWYQWYLFGSSSAWSLVVWNMQPRSQELNNQIQHKLQKM